MNKAAIYHVPEYIYAYPVGKDCLCLRLLAARNDLQKVRVRYRNLYEHVKPMKTALMEKILSDAEHDVFETTIVVKERRFRYYFELEGDERVCYNIRRVFTNRRREQLFLLSLQQ